MCVYNVLYVIRLFHIRLSMRLYLYADVNRWDFYSLVASSNDMLYVRTVCSMSCTSFVHISHFSLYETASSC